MIFNFLLIIFVAFIIYYIHINHLHVDWKSFFKKGFQKVDNLFGLYCYCGKQRYTARRIQLLNSSKICLKQETI